MSVVDVHPLSMIAQGAFPCVLSGLFLVFFIFFDNSLTKKTQHLFLLATICILCLTISESIDYYFQQTQSHYKARIIISAFSYTFRIASTGFTAAITQRTKSVGLRFIYAGIFINMIISFVSIPTGCIFSINEYHQWSRGILYPIPYLIVAWYSITIVVSVFQNIRSNKKEALILIAGSFLCILGNMIEIVFHWKLILSQVFIIHLCFYFLCLIALLYRRDAMTNLFNRRSFYLNAKSLEGHHFIVVSMDLNDLKKYNDVEGHSAGDRAICEVAEIIRSSFEKHGTAYRIGGDEFMAIFPHATLEDAEIYIEQFQNRLSKTKYKVACGYVLCKPGDGIDMIVASADEKMYEDKKRQKGKGGIVR